MEWQLSSLPHTNDPPIDSMEEDSVVENGSEIVLVDPLGRPAQQDITKSIEID